MSRWSSRALLVLFVGGVTACSSEPRPQPASAVGLPRRPVKPILIADEPGPDSTVENVHIDPAIAKACDMPTPHFAFDSASLDPDPILDSLAKCFTTGPMKDRKMKLIGHTDPRGDTDYNFALGQKRAGTVQAYLELHGMAAPNIATISRGELDASGSDETGWSEDRRVDVLLGD